MADSADNITASAPSNTAVATSETSARVGAGAVIIALHHLRGDHHWLARLARGPGDLLLQTRDLLHRHLDAKIAARHHDAVGDLDNLLELGERRGLFDLGHDRRAPTHQVARLGDVLGPLHEGQRNPIDADIERILEIDAVLVGHGIERNDRVGKADALAAAKRASGQHFGIDAHVARLDHPQTQLAVIEQKRVTGLHGLEDLRMRQVHAAKPSHRLAADETHYVTLGEPNGARFELADAELRPLQIDQNADRAGELELDLVNDGVCFPQELWRRMTHIDAKNVGARLEQSADHLFVVGGRTEGGDDLDSAIAPH